MEKKSGTIGGPVPQHNICEPWKRQDELQSRHGDNGRRKNRRRD